jgi:hypothetical protein
MKLTAVLDIDARYSDLPEPKGETRPVSVRGCEFMACVRAKFFAVDENGEGHVFKERPVWNGEYWMQGNDGLASYARYVGNFDLEGLSADLTLEEI